MAHAGPLLHGTRDAVRATHIDERNLVAQASHLAVSGATDRATWIVQEQGRRHSA